MQTYKLINYEQRVLISHYLKEGKNQSEIGRLLSKDRSVISREIRRNSSSGSYQLYTPKQAQNRAEIRSKFKGRKPLIQSEIKVKIESLLKLQWIPEQIHGRTKREGKSLASHETIYQYIYKDKKSGGDLFNHLRQRHRARYKRVNTTKRRGVIQDRISISKRPQIIEERVRLGDWEGDTMIGKNHKSAIATMVDRTSKETKIVKLNSRNAKHTSRKIIIKMKATNKPINSITFDNGKEFSEHKRISKHLNTSVYFADPYSAFQRGTNENTNGLIRKYLPKGTDLNMINHHHIKIIENRLNNRPRKSLGYLTPNEYICSFVAINS